MQMEQLPDDFKVQLEPNLLKEFEYEFLSSGYHVMRDIISALDTILRHLIKALDEEDETLNGVQAIEFMLNVYEGMKIDEVLDEIGLCDLSQARQQCLIKLPLSSAYACFQLFQSWVKEGYFDYAEVPFRYKAHLSHEDKITIEQHISRRWEGNVTDLQKKLHQFVKILKKAEQDIIHAETIHVREEFRNCGCILLHYFISGPSH